MAAEQRRLLEQLMGDQLLSAQPGPKQAALTLTDPAVCRSYVAGSCPHDLFTNTKQDFGACPKTHQPNLKDEYVNLPEEERKALGFEWDYQRDIGRYVSECDRRIDIAQRRLEKTAEEVRQTGDLMRAIQEAGDRIEAGLMEVEILAEEGGVNTAVLEFHKLKHVKFTQEEKQRELKTLSETGGPSGHQKLQVCDVCGAYLSRLDNDRRLADHFFGKMHLGYAQMRKESERLGKELKGRQPPAGRGREEDMPDLPRFDDGGLGGGFGGRGGYGGGGGFGGGRGRGGGGRDLTIICDDQTHHVHKAIICPQSAFSEAACQPGRFREGQEGTIKISTARDVEDTDLPFVDDPEAVRMMVHYFYHRDYPRPGESTPSSLVLHAKVFSVAVKYEVKDLRALAAFKFSKLVESARSDNVIPILLDDFAAAIEVVLVTTADEELELRECVSAKLTRAQDKGLLKVEAIAEAVQKVNGLAWALLKRAMMVDESK